MSMMFILAEVSKAPTENCGVIITWIQVCTVGMILVLLFSVYDYYFRPGKKKPEINEVTIDLSESKLKSLNDSEFRKHIEEKIKIALKQHGKK